MTPLDKTLKRSLTIGGVDYVLTLTAESLKLTRKGKRLGIELKWTDITSGESALALALQASMGQFEPGKRERPAKDKAKPVVVSPKRRRSPAKRSRDRLGNR